MSWDHLPPISSFPKAHRKEVYRRLTRSVTGGDDGLIPFEEVRERLRLWQQSYKGVRTIRVDNIVGSAARSSDFTDDWLPKRPHMRRRWEALEKRWPEGDFPPIQAYEVNGAYYVIDGHHRVAIAKSRGIEFLDAEITEIHTGLDITPEMDFGKLLHLQQEQAFMDHSGLGRVRPDARILVSRAVGYRRMLEHVRVHGYHLMQARQRVLPPEVIAADWYERTYLPTIETARREGLVDAMKDSTEGDVFLWIHQRRRRLLVEDETVSYEDTVLGAAEEKKAKSLPGRTRKVFETVENAVEDVVDRLAGKDPKGS
ncbi:MAG TPA: hypothetical protein VLD62_11980 [Acidimicrobiia bacterium]|nr:hypothetical protein [Acidimicrobiia bacterium]